MNLENINKKVLIIILALIILLFINAPNFIFIFLLAAFSLLLLIGLFGFFKNDNETRKEKLKIYIFNIYWKKILFFVIIFYISDIFSAVVLSTLSFNVVGFPVPYFVDYWDESTPLFSPAIFIMDIVFWYIIASFIIKKPLEMSGNIVRLNYIVLIAALIFLLCSSWDMYRASNNYLNNSLSLNKNKIEECENFSNEQGNDQQYSQRFNCYVDYAIKNDDIKLCRFAKHIKKFDIGGGWSSVSGGEEVCYEEVALRTLNFEICNNIDNPESSICSNAVIRAQCYSMVAIAMKDSSTCDRIEDLGKDCEGMAIKEIKDECNLKVNNK